MTGRIKKYLLDILDAANSIDNYISGIDFARYQKNKMIRRAVEREFEIIGEALNAALKIDSSLEISSKERIIGMRNRVIHGYDKIDDGIIWGLLKNIYRFLKVK